MIRQLEREEGDEMRKHSLFAVEVKSEVRKGNPSRSVRGMGGRSGLSEGAGRLRRASI